jgi:site-specific recombinase XerD
MEKAITEILFMVSQGKDLEVALHTVLSRYTMESKENALVVQEDSWQEDLMFYLKRKILEGKSKGSIENYKYVITCFFQFVNKAVRDVTADDIQLYLSYKKNVNGSSDKYLCSIRTVLNGFFVWCIKNHVIEHNPIDAVPLVKVRKKHVKGYTEEELERLRIACSKGRNRKRDRAILELLDSSGMRCNELIQLDIADIDLDAREGIIHHGKGDKERVFFFSKVAAMYIKEYLNDYNGVDGALFVSEKSHRRFRDDSSVETIVKKWGDLAGVPNAKPHRFRHTFITRCIDKGISIEDTRQLVGHENIGTTEGYYDHNQSRVKAEHDRLCA